MPIKGLSEIRRLPRIGKIKLGIMVAKAETGARYPEETDYFVCPEIIQRIYGKEPKELVILFPVEDDTVFFQQWLMRYANEVVLCKGDGEDARYWDFDTGKYADKKCLFTDCEYFEQKKCKPVGRLQFILPEVEDAAGVWQIDTSSKNSIKDINSGIDYIRRICGRISWIPIKLIRAPMTTQRIEGKKVKTGKHFTLKFSLEGMTIGQLQKAAQVDPHTYFLPEPDESQPEDIFPPNGHQPEAEKPTELQEKSEDIKPEDQDGKKEESRKVWITTADGQRRKVTRLQALQYFEGIKEEMPDEHFYAVLGNEGYEKPEQIPDDTLGKVFKALLLKLNDLTEQPGSDK
jgi:hypothetical protein